MQKYIVSRCLGMSHTPVIILDGNSDEGELENMRSLTI